MVVHGAGSPPRQDESRAGGGGHQQQSAAADRPGHRFVHRIIPLQRPNSVMYHRMAAIDAADVDAEFGRAVALHGERLTDEAMRQCRRVLKLQPHHVGALNLLAVLSMQRDRPSAAVRLLTRVIGIDRNLHAAHYNRGNALRALGRHKAALACYDAAIELRGDFAAAHYNRGNALRELGQTGAAVDAYTRAIELKPDFAEAINNRGLMLRSLNRVRAAIADFAAVIALAPDFAPAHVNHGDALVLLKQFAAAVESYDRAIAIEPAFAQGHAKRANALQELGRFDAAIAGYDAALAIDPTLDGLFGARLYAALQICDWRDHGRDIAELAVRIGRHEAAAHPFCVLVTSDSPEIQNEAARLWVRAQCPPNPALGAIRRSARRRKIRIGYFSGDFRNHPVARLTAELFEAHDRSRFEVLGFSYGPDTRDEMRRRLGAAFDRFLDVREHSDSEIALQARHLRLDIAVDLGGFTQHSRPGVFALRAAAVQAVYIGYLGTLAAPYMDYLIADPSLIPRAWRRHYREKIAYLPSYQVNDSKRRIGDRVFTRQELGMPRAGVVFCCFNANHKITPQTFAGWMRILGRVAGSVLLLYAENDAAERNLRAEARRSGVDECRLVFAGRLPYADYLARYRIADLFLDTYPYNAGATASDALWTGLPVLTRRGASMASRMGSSLLQSLGLPELVTSTQAQYEAVAVELGTHAKRLAGIRQKLAANRPAAPLFDTRRFTACLEKAYAGMHERSRAGMAPADIHVQAAP